MSKKKLLLVPFGAVALLLTMAIAAYACTTYAGQFKVTGDLGGTVTSTGVPGPGLMVGVLTGSTSASDGTAGEITIETNAVVTAVPMVTVTSLPTGYYSINVWDGNAYSNQSVVSAQPPFLTLMQDCMNSPGGSVENLGRVHVNSSGVIDEKNGVSDGPTVDFDNLDVGATTDTSIVAPLGGGQAAVCISGTNGSSTANDGASVGNQVPITFV